MAEYFDVLKSIINKKPIDPADVETHYSGFMASRWLSANPMACYTVNLLNSTRGNCNIPKMAEYKFLLNSIKLPKNTYLPFDKNDKDMKTIIDVISREFSIGENSIKDYINILGGARILKILEKHAQMTNNHTTDPRILEIRKALKNKKKELLKMKGL